VAGLCGASGAAAEPTAAGADRPGIGPPKGHRWEPIAELTDEFDGAKLDESKCHPRNPTWKG